MQQERRREQQQRASLVRRRERDRNSVQERRDAQAQLQDQRAQHERGGATHAPHSAEATDPEPQRRNQQREQQGDSSSLTATVAGSAFCYPDFNFSSA